MAAPLAVMDTENPAFVIDNGSYFCRAGFSGDDAPKECLPTIVNTLVQHHSELRVSTNCMVCTEAPCGKIDLKYPIKRGLVTDWDSMEKVGLVISNYKLCQISLLGLAYSL